jgi:hypothetical protein
MPSSVPRRSARLASKVRAETRETTEATAQHSVERPAVTTSPVPCKTQAEYDAEDKKRAEEIIEYYKNVRYEELKQYETQLTEYKNTQSKYWELNVAMFQHFYRNLTYFKKDTALLKKMIDLGVDMAAIAYDSWGLSSKVTGIGEFIRLVNNVIGAATIALRTNGRVIL